jgi:hypothetical protein
MVNARVRVAGGDSGGPIMTYQPINDALLDADLIFVHSLS